MEPPPSHWEIPAAPVLSAERALSTFEVPNGFSVELVAAEPMVHDPVALAFDGNGRIWVAEMRGYMPDIDGKGEDQPTGRISVMEDSNGDGKADRHEVFLDGIVLPRAVALSAADRALLYADDEALHEVQIIETEGGLPRPGDRIVVDPQYAKGGNPEHKPNGLLMALDNWIYSAKSDLRYRRSEDGWVSEKSEFRGQWGIDQDDSGRLYTNTNSNAVSAEILFPGASVRNPSHAFRSPLTSKLADQSLWPSRITPGVNRGYLSDTLDEEGRLRSPTAVSGLAVYRGDQFPAEYQGNLFINEPGAHLVKRALVEESGGRLQIRQAYKGREFFTSTDERSRVVNCYTAPDGTLYLVDFYRGILQHRVYMTTYLRRQVEERGLDKPVGLGRIWRVIHEGQPRGEQPRMHGESDAELVARLSHPNGWWRDTARRLIVERGGEKAVPALRRLAGTPEADPRGRIQAIWALEGLDALNAGDIAAAIAADPEVAAQALRAGESLAGGPDAGEVLRSVAASLEKEAPALPWRRQLLASLGRFAATDDAEASAAARALLLRVLDTPAEGQERTLGEDLALSGLAGQEGNFLIETLERQPGARIALPLAAAVVKSGDAAGTARLLERIAGLEAGPRASLTREISSAAARNRRAGVAERLLAAAEAEPSLLPAVAEGLLAGSKAGGANFKPMPLESMPGLVSAEGGIPDAGLREQLAALFDVSGAKAESYLKTDADLALFDLGKQHYSVLCGACHQPHGQGQEFIAPPLVDSEWVTGPPSRLIALTLDGMMGPVTVRGKVYAFPEIQPIMPGLRGNPEFDDEKIAAMLTYVRNEWGNAAPPVTPEMVESWRSRHSARAPFTEAELLEIE